MSDLLNQASLVMVPSGYKEDTVYSVVPSDGSGDLTFTRASNGTRVNSAGLVEVVPWNLVTYSNDFSSSWALNEASKSTGITDPIGNANAVKLKYTTATSAHYITQGITLTGSNAHSVYAKAGELQFLQIASAQSIDEYANFNLSTGAVGTYGSYASNVQIENVGNEWYRCSVVFTNGSNGIYLAIVQSASSDWFGVATYAGANSTNGLYLYGGQVNAGTLKPYFPTADRLNVPRLTYQNGGGGCPSLLLEKQSTNTMLNSENLNSWLQIDTSVTSNSTTSPDGTQNADTVTATGSGSLSHLIYQNLAFTSGTAYTLSVFAKANTSNFIQLVFSGDFVANSYANFNLSNGTITASANLTPKIESMGNGWYRCSISATAGATATNSQIIYLINSGTASRGQSFTASGESVYLWGGQFEASSYATSYIGTTSSSATRVADACYKTGISSLVGHSEGFIAGEVEGLTNSYGSQSTIMSVGDGTTANRIMFSFNATTGYVTPRIFKAGSTIFVNDYAITLTQKIKFAIGWGGGRAVCYVNGTQVQETTGLTFFSSGTLTRFGADDGAGSNIGIGKVSEYILGTTNLTNAQLQSLTI